MMRHRLQKVMLLGAAIALPLSLCVAQFREGSGRGFRFFDEGAGPIVRTEGGEEVNEDTVQTARETAPHSIDLPSWTNAPGFERDVFTFTRIIFRSAPGRPSWLGWVNDYPDADPNLSGRLQQLTSLKVNPDGRVLKLTNAALTDFPFIFMSHPERMELSDDETEALRKHLVNGATLMVDDIWGARNWNGFETQMKRVPPGRSWAELPSEHPLFHCVFDLRGKVNDLQVPTMQRWRRSYDPGNPGPGPSWFRGEGSEEMHVRAWLDDQQRIMVLALHNTDTGDGWEREGENEIYFQQFSETRAYPLAINALFYLMTH